MNIGMFKAAPRVMSAIAPHPYVAWKIAGALALGAFREARHMARTAQQCSHPRSKMLISKKFRFLWILIPKAASRSLLMALRNADPNAEKVDGRSLREVYARRPEIKDYYSCTFVRHPFDRALSWYCDVFLNPKTYTEANTMFVRREDDIFFDDGTRSTRLPYDPSEVEDADARHKERKRRRFLRDYYGIAETSSFDDFCQWLNTPWGSDAFADQHFVSQHRLTDSKDKRPLDFVGRLENIDTDFNRVAASLGMPPPKLLLSNTRAGWLPKPEALKATRAAQESLLTERNRELLTTRYAEDLELFGYSPA